MRHRVWGLPGGQKQPSTQWSSHNWERWGLEQVSVQGEPHSWYCMPDEHVWAAEGSRAQPCLENPALPHSYPPLPHDPEVPKASVGLGFSLHT